MAKQPLNHDITEIDIQFLVIILSAFFGSLILFLLLISQIFKLPLPELISQFKNSLYFPNMNQFIVGEIGGKNVLKLFYGFLLLATSATIISFMFFSHSSGKRQSAFLPHLVTMTGITGLLLLSAVQQVHRFDYFKREETSFKGKSVDEKNLLLFKTKYQFAHACQKTVSENHQGTLISDFNLRKSPYMFFHRLLSYHLYPKISLRFDNGSPKDTVVLFYKKDPLEHIPENYRILLSTEDQNYILAIKKQGLE